MAKYQLLLPKMGESVAEATIIRWLKSPGDHIEADEAIMEIATDKVDSEIPSPVSGILAEQLCNENDVVQVGSVIAVINTNDGSAHEPEVSIPEYSTAEEETQPVEPVNTQNIPGISQLEQRAAEPVQQSVPVSNGARFYSPLVKNIAAQENISASELDRIPGTGADNRLTKDDLLNYIEQRQPTQGGGSAASSYHTPTPVAEVPKPQQPAAEPAKPVQQAPVQETPTLSVATSKPAYSVSGGDEIIEMDRMRKLIADHMVMSKHTSPHVTSFVEADVTNLVKWREKIKKSFESREGERITFTPIFIEAVVKAIKDFPLINSSVNGTQIIKKRDINIGMATALPSGNLIVPVIHKADALNLIGLTKSVNDLANRARANKLQPDEVKNGTFTITNVGSFGNVMGTPIINQPQVAILAIGIIKKKPAVLETKDGDVIAIRHMMFLSLSYDHRVVDGALGGSFVRRVADYLENWDLNTEI
jgi:2-oxoglutarate dehydrogenase E2 component (dihydrolipoamide succinyltransferase)